MTTYNTGNPVGSSDPRDLYDNAENLDEFSNSGELRYNDRLGVSRRTLAGINQIAAGYNPRGEFVTGTAYNVNDLYIATAGTYAGSVIQVMQDHTSTTTDSDIASGYVTLHQPHNYVAPVDAITDLRALEPLFDGQQVSLSGYHSTASPEQPKGGGIFTAKYGNYSAEVSADTLTGIYVAFPSDPTGASGAWVRSTGGYVSTAMFGAKYDGINDDSPATSAAAAMHPGKWVHLPTGTHKFNSPVIQSTIGNGNSSVCKFYGDGMYNTIVDNNTSGAAFIVTSGDGAEFAYGFELSDMAISSLSAVSGSIGLEMIGCRFAHFKNLFIHDVDSHGIYGASTVGDLTDTAQIVIEQCQIENCGGYGVYAKSDGDAIQYAWNFYQTRIGNNGLGGVLGESITNIEMVGGGVYYNSGFGVRVDRGTSGAPSAAIINISLTEFDTNEGRQIDIQDAHAVTVRQAYLIDNNLTPAFTTGIYLGSVDSVVVEQAVPRIDPAVTGISIVEVSEFAEDVVVRDSDYQGWSVLNGSYYIDNSTGQLTIDDRVNRFTQYNGTWTVEIKNLTDTVTSPTAATGSYVVNGKSVLASFRYINDIDLSGFSTSDIIVATAPIKCTGSSDAGYCGSCILTDYSGGGTPVPCIDPNSQIIIFLKSTDATLILAGDLNSSVSDLRYCTIQYAID